MWTKGLINGYKDLILVAIYWWFTVVHETPFKKAFFLLYFKFHAGKILNYLDIITHLFLLLWRQRHTIMDDRSRMGLQTMQKTALIKRHLTLIFANIYRPNAIISFSKLFFICLTTKYNYLFLMADVLKLFNCHLLFWYTTLSPNVFIHCFSVFRTYLHCSLV